MDNSSNNIESILTSSNTYSDQSTGFFSGIQNISISTWIIIILILALLGFNIFVYLAKGTQTITDIFSPIINKFVSIFASTTKQVVNVSAEGAKTVVNTTANTVDAGLSEVQNITAPSSLKSEPITNDVPYQNRTIKHQMLANEYSADDSTSTIQSGSQKSGWCYIGEDRGFRSCAEVGINDTCMSGDIFPSHEICVNPTLRA
jgi:hypothetical protein